MASVITNGFLGLAAAMSGKKRRPKWTSADDFIDKDFRKLAQRVFGESRRTNWDSLIADAKAKGLAGPW